HHHAAGDKDHSPFLLGSAALCLWNRGPRCGRSGATPAARAALSATALLPSLLLRHNQARRQREHAKQQEEKGRSLGIGRHEHLLPAAARNACAGKSFGGGPGTPGRGKSPGCCSKLYQRCTAVRMRIESTVRRV